MKPAKPTLLATTEATRHAELPSPEPEERISRREFALRNLSLFTTVALVHGSEETHHLALTRHSVQIPKLSAPLRVVQLTDLHRSWCVSERFIAKIVAETNALRPDLILLTGDFVTKSSGYADSCMRPLAQLRAPMGRLAVLGNHDYWCDHNTGAPVIAAHLADIGVELLTNRSVRLSHNLRIVGVDDGAAGQPNLPEAFAQVEPNEAVLAMTHNPLLFPLMAAYPCVTFAGHTHGGQIDVPLLTSALFRGNARFLRGWYRQPDAPGSLYVSRGLGTVHIPLRINSTPEIALFDLIPE